MDLKARINEALTFEESKAEWRNVHTSKEFRELSELGKIVGSPLNKSRNCSCIEDLFIVLKLMKIEKIKLKETQMDSKFKLKEGVLLFYPKLGRHLSEANITDKLAKELLKEFPIKINAFAEFPEDWNKKKEVKEVEVVEKKTTKKSYKK